MRSHVGVASMITVLGAVAGCSSSSGSPSSPVEAGPPECVDAIGNVFNDNASVACPIDANGNPLSYDEAITNTCATENLTAGDIEYGQCFDYLVFEVDQDASGDNRSECFYDVTSHAFVGIIYGDGMKDQCGGTSTTVAAGAVDTTCTISGLNGGGSGFQSCTPIPDAGGESSLLMR
jgi:hypothetical protein